LAGAAHPEGGGTGTGEREIGVRVSSRDTDKKGAEFCERRLLMVVFGSAVTA
jgi:hypothetical protein